MKIKKILRKFGFDIVRYHSFWDDIAKPRNFKTILDIGANDGSSAKSLRKRFPSATIYSFEPLHDCFKTLENVMAGDSAFKAFNVALGEENTQTVIHRSSSHASSSLLSMGALHKKLYPKSAEHTEETIQVKRLDEVLKNIHLEAPVLVKIDVQGFEASVIRGGGEVLQKCDTVLIENSFVELYEGQELFAGIHDLLHNLGFSYRGRSETHYNSSTKEPIYEDSVFIKEH